MTNARRRVLVPISRPTAPLLALGRPDPLGELRARPGGDVNIMGSATVAQALLANDLVDELDLMIEPIVLGGGKSIYSADGEARRFRLDSVTQATTGVLCCRYVPQS